MAATAITAMAMNRKMRRVVSPAREDMRLLLNSSNLVATLYPYSMITRPTKNRASGPDMPAMTLMSCSAAYTIIPGRMKNRDSSMMMNPRGARNLFLLAGSDIILDTM